MDLRSAAMERNETIAKMGMVNVMRMILRYGQIGQRLFLIIPRLGKTYCFCSEGLEK